MTPQQAGGLREEEEAEMEGGDNIGKRRGGGCPNTR
jgi:hypothetical protein